MSAEKDFIVEGQEMSDDFARKLVGPLKPRKYDFVWRNIAIIGSLHLFGLFGFWLFLSGHCKWQSFFYMLFVYISGGFGATAGAHRLWAHRSYKAKAPLRVLLMILQTQSFQGPIISWVRDHRAHHKFTDTDADPYNPARGFIFAHFGWTITRKLPEVAEGTRRLNHSDLYNDPIVMFQKRHYWKLSYLFVFLIPTVVPVYFWSESVASAFFFCSCSAWVMVMNASWSVNSFAHLMGHKPYDKDFSASENAFTSFFIFGDGWHNYHHAFPSDYKTAELGNYSLNTSKLFIDVMAAIGWAYDLKTASPEIIKQRMLKTGDGTHASVWGEIEDDEAYKTSNRNGVM